MLALAVSAEGKRCGGGVGCTDDVDSSQVATVKTNWVDAANPTACRALGGDPWSPSGRCYIKPAHLSTEVPANQIRTNLFDETRLRDSHESAATAIHTWNPAML